jgi:hypothetical protein
MPGIGVVFAPVLASQRGFTTTLNVIRVMAAKALIEQLQKSAEPTQEELEHVGSMVNIFTGRGGWNADAVSGFSIFSPRLVASRFQIATLAPIFFTGGSTRTKLLAAEQYAKILSGIGIIYLLAALFKRDEDPDPVFDWRSGDFGKVRRGKAYIDPLFGLAQVTRILGTIITGERLIKNEDGSDTIIAMRNGLRPYEMFRDADHKIKFEDKFGQPGVIESAFRFARTKFSPFLSYGSNLLTEEDVVGRKIDTADKRIEETVKMAIPLSTREFIPLMVDRGWTEGSALYLLNLLGMGVQVYERDRKKAAYEESLFVESDPRM